MEITPYEWEPPEWHEPKDLRPRYRVARVAFALTGIGFGLLALDLTCHLLAIFGQNPNLENLRNTPGWQWVVGAPITWCTFLGSVLFVGRFDNALWKRWTILLLLMNTFDMGTWCLHNADAIGLQTGHELVRLQAFFKRHDGFFFVISPFMNLIEVMLCAILARDICTHLGKADVNLPFAATRSVVIVSVLLELFMMVNVVQFAAGWPVQIFFRRDPMIALAYVGGQFGFAISTYLSVYLMAMAAQQCSLVIRDLNRQSEENDPFAQ